MESLPLDIKLEIFEYLKLNDIKKFSQVNKYENIFKQHDKCQQLIERKMREKKVRKLEPILSPIITYAIKHLTNYILFDYGNQNIIFISIEREPSYPFERFLTDDEMTSKQSKIAETYLQFMLAGNVNVHTWVNLPFLSHVTQLEIKNHHGVNDDQRSHRGDCLYTGNQQEVIRRKAYIDGKDEDNDEEDEDNDEEDEDNDEEDEYDNDDDDEYYNMNKKYYNEKWEKTNKNGITWGDIMEGVMNVKGSKSDFWYELICEAKCKINDTKLSIELEMDHGS